MTMRKAQELKDKEVEALRLLERLRAATKAKRARRAH